MKISKREIKLLKKQLAKVTLERDILKKAGKCLFASKRSKFEFIKQHKICCPVRDMANHLGVSKSGYYKWAIRTLSNRAQNNLVLLEEIKKIHYRNKKRYGSPRIAKELEVKGFHASEKLIRKLMKSASLQSVFKRKFRITTNSSHKYPTVQNKLGRNFFAKQENEIWVSDITYIWAGKRWLYLTVIMDLFDRKIIGWTLSTTLKTKYTTLKAFEIALSNRPVSDNTSLIFHSDRGIQYACKEFLQELEKHKSIIRSMSGKGNCWDNAVSESFFKTLKTELIYQNRYQTLQEAESSIRIIYTLFTIPKDGINIWAI